MDRAKLLERGIAEIITVEELEPALQGPPLRLKYGVDPSRPDLHLGHVVCFRKLRQFQELGHKVCIIVGDWTAQIGDPSGKSATRTMLSAEEVRANAATYMAQLFKVVDEANTEVLWQSAWFGKFDLADVIRLTSRFTVAQLLAREDFSNRLKANAPIAVTELLYPLMQAYDSIAMKSDVEFGGSDQKFNCLLGRDLQRQMGMRPQQVVMMPILVGTDGVQKMSKSLGNYIAVMDPADEMYGKVMSVSDDAMWTYYELLTDVPMPEVERLQAEAKAGRLNPRDAKMSLARDIVTQFHTPEQAREAEEAFVHVFQQRELPEDMPVLDLNHSAFADDGQAPIVDVLVAAQVAPSKSEARRLVQQGAVSIDGNKVETPDQAITLADGVIIRVGRRRFVRLSRG